MRAFLTIMTCLGWAGLASAEHAYLQLQDRLDRPQDGFCLDVLGAGQTFRTDMPLTAHNCKPGNAPDGRVTLRSDGSLYMPAFDACVTAMGVNRTALSGMALMLRPCSDRAGFAPDSELQRFGHASTGEIRLRDTDLCLTVGAQSGPTFSPSHAWRTLFMETCGDAPKERQIWTFIPPSDV